MRRFGVNRLSFAALGLSALLVGCDATYMNYPAIGNDAAINDPNNNPMPLVIERALTRTFSDSPSETPYVVNFPRGFQRGSAERILDAIGDPRAELAALRVSGLPVYHVNRVWVRGSRARVEILAPVKNAADPYDIVVVRLERRAISDWKAVDVTRWPGENTQAPPLYGWRGVAERVGDKP